MSSFSSCTGQPVNFHTNVNRAKTKRWVEAKSYAYDGDDWGDGDEYEDGSDEPAPQSEPARSQHAQPPLHLQTSNPDQVHTARRYGDLSFPQSRQFANRSATNPAPTPNTAQPSFDQGERRSFSTNIGGFGGPYPTAQRAPFSPVDPFPPGQHHDPQVSPQTGPQPISSLQEGRRPSMDQEPFPHATFVSGNAPGPYCDPKAGPYPGPLSQRGRRSQSSGRPSQGDIYSGGISPNRAIPSPLSAVSQGSRDGSPGKSLPPRKSSLSHQAVRSDFNQTQMSREYEVEHQEPLQSPVDTKPVPFIRPADIYKRMAEEKEKERRASEESFRPKPTLDSVQERISEHGIEKSIKETQPAQGFPPPSRHPATANGDGLSEPVENESTWTHGPLQPAKPSSVVSEARGFHADSTPGGRQSASPSRMAEGLDQHRQAGSALHHNPSAGFTSVVHRAFDDSQNTVPPTPSSTSGNSIVRSNSASASDISPIIQSIPSDPRWRPTSSSTIIPITSHDLSSQGSDPLPSPSRPGYRRDDRTPSPGNSPARRPISIDTADAPREEIGIVSTITPTQSKPVHVAPSSIPRAESPSKGTVRDLAGRFENRSPASSPVRGSASLAEAPRPSNPHLESFRPSLPGGWISYTTSTGNSSPVRGSTPIQSVDNLSTESAAVPDPQVDAGPTAGPPKPREAGYETSGKAFEALAAAGSALS